MTWTAILGDRHEDLDHPSRSPASPVSGLGWKRSLSLPSTIRLIWHASEPHPRDVPLDEVYARIDPPPAVPDLPAVIANMVTTLNGEAAIDGKASPIGTPVDALLLRRLRRSADVLLSGAGTLAAEDVTAVVTEEDAAVRTAAGRPPRLLVALLATRLAWDDAVLGHRFFTDTRFDKLIITGDRAGADAVRRAQDRGVEVVRVAAADGGHPDATAALRFLGDRGARLVLSEGGPRVLGSLLRARLVGEYFLTTSPLVTADPGAPRPIAGSPPSGGPLRLSRASRYEFAFQDPETKAALVEAYERFRVIYRS